MVQAAIDAYHAHDLDRCLSYYAPDVVVKDADGRILMDGAEAVRARYARSMTENPTSTTTSRTGSRSATSLSTKSW